ncbi:hypothetical protein N9459_03790 [Flavobacteriaceae bacterium]|nr:hypothetical protein [Flavobacteriaceae bacterium]
MAFQSGTAVDPRLMQADYSGFTNAAAITADAQKELAGNISDAIGAYQDNKKEDKAFAQKVKSSLALTDSMMENLDPEQADQLARFATESGVNDPRLSMRERAQAAETFGASLSAIMKSLQDDEITFKQGPGGLTVVMQNDEALKVVQPDPMAAFYNQFGGTETPEQIAERERLIAERAALQANR